MSFSYRSIGCCGLIALVVGCAQDAPMPCPARTLADQTRCGDMCGLFGTCRANTSGGCIAEHDCDCEQSILCSDGGNCGARLGVCVPRNDSDCGPSAVCYHAGLCTAVDEKCVAGKSSDCANSRNCQKKGLCSLIAEGCAATGQDCLGALACKSIGECTVENGKCVVGSHSDCTNADVCRSDGKCQRVGKSCAAASETDCLNSEMCKAAGRCKYDKKWGSCVRRK